jgi:alpha-tubulin suppressor-like RCC1 family protein
MTRKRLKIADAPDRGERCIVSCGGAHTLLLTSIGTLVAWGAGGYGQLGSGDVWDRDDPIIVTRVRSVIAFAAGARHSLAVEGVSDRKGYEAPSEVVFR